MASTSSSKELLRREKLAEAVKQSGVYMIKARKTIKTNIRGTTLGQKWLSWLIWSRVSIFILNFNHINAAIIFIFYRLEFVQH